MPGIHFPNAGPEWLVNTYLGTLSIDTALLPAPTTPIPVYLSPYRLPNALGDQTAWSRCISPSSSSHLPFQTPALPLKV